MYVLAASELINNAGAAVAAGIEEAAKSGVSAKSTTVNELVVKLPLTGIAFVFVIFTLAVPAIVEVNALPLTATVPETPTWGNVPISTVPLTGNVEVADHELTATEGNDIILLLIEVFENATVPLTGKVDVADQLDTAT